jgi:hypothetical protein
MATGDERKLKRLIQALQARRGPHLRELEHSAPTKILAQRRRTAKQLRSLLVKAGLNVDEMDKIRSADQAARLKLLARQQSNANRLTSKRERSLQRQLDADRQTAEELATHDQLATIYLSPFHIVMGEGAIDDHIEPWNSWAKANWDSGEVDWSITLNILEQLRGMYFYFYWRNQNATWAVVNAASRLALRGNCMAIGNTGVVYGGFSHLQVYCSLAPVEAWRNPDRYADFQESSRKADVASLHADGGGLWSFETGDVDDKRVHESVYLQYPRFSIPPNELALFEVWVQVYQKVFNGRAIADFGSRPEYSIACPFLSLEINPRPPTD